MAAADPSPSHPSPDASQFHDSVPPYMAAVAAYAPGAAPPWLFIPSRCSTAVYAINCLNNSSAPEIYTIPLPDHLHGYDLVSSLGHRLLYEKPCSLSGIRLFNPFSSSAKDARLPPSGTLMPPSVNSIVPQERRLFRYQIDTVVADTDSGIAVALLGNGVCRLAYTKSPCTDDRWINLTYLLTDTEDEYISFQSATLYRNGYFCAAVDYTGRKVSSFDFSGSLPTLSDITFNLPNHFYGPFVVAEWCCYQSASLVNSGGSLFIVRWRNTLNKDGVKYKREIDIHRLDAKEWVPVPSLGDHSFFIGHTNQSFSVSTTDFPGLKSNRVYLSLDATIRVAGDEYRCPYDERDRDQHGLHLVYHLEDKSWDVFYDDGHVLPRYSLWMIPDAIQARRDAELKSHQMLDS